MESSPPEHDNKQRVKRKATSNITRMIQLRNGKTVEIETQCFVDKKAHVTNGNGTGAPNTRGGVLKAHVQLEDPAYMALYNRNLGESPLLALPIEIRKEVYFHLISTTEPLSFDPHYIAQVKLPTRPETENAHASLLKFLLPRVCRQFYVELSSLLFSSMTAKRCKKSLYNWTRTPYLSRGTACWPPSGIL